MPRKTKKDLEQEIEELKRMLFDSENPVHTIVVDESKEFTATLCRNVLTFRDGVSLQLEAVQLIALAEGKLDTDLLRQEKGI